MRSKTPECLDFLVERFGNELLRSEVLFQEDHRYLTFPRIPFSLESRMPIHAAVCSNPEMLRAIIKHYPDHWSIYSGYYISKVASPLHRAVSGRRYDNVQVLLETMPKLIKFVDHNKNTAIHFAAWIDCHMLGLLLNVASRKIITARNNKGNTVLHLAADYMKRDIIDLLMNTGYFTGTERNHDGITPVFYFNSHNSPVPNSELMRIFRFQTEQQVIDALTIKKSIFRFM